MKLLGAILIIALADVLAYVQMYGPTMWKFNKLQTVLIVLLGIPISYLYVVGTKFSIDALESQWASRVMFLLLGNLVFLLCALFIAGEQLTIKNGVLICLTLAILAVQVLWK